MSALAKRQATRRDRKAEPTGEGCFDRPGRSTVGWEVNPGSENESRLPVDEWVVVRDNAADAVQTESRVAERVEVKSALHFESVAVPGVAVLPRTAGSCQKHETDVRARGHVRTGGDLA